MLIVQQTHYCVSPRHYCDEMSVTLSELVSLSPKELNFRAFDFVCIVCARFK